MEVNDLQMTRSTDGSLYRLTDLAMGRSDLNEIVYRVKHEACRYRVMDVQRVPVVAD